MAISGSATTAYICRIVDGKLYTQHTTVQRSLCVPLDLALPKLAAGEKLTIAGNDMAALRMRLQNAGVDTSIWSAAELANITLKETK